MKKAKILSNLILIFTLYPNLAKSAGPKFVIGGRTDCGFFSNFLGVLNNLHWCEKTAQIPVVYWPKQGKYYDPNGCNGIISDNIWDYYFYPVSNLTYSAQDPINFSYYPPDNFCIAAHPGAHWAHPPYPDKYWRNYMHDLIARYIKIKEPTLNKIENFYNNNIKGKRTVSIHIRGTDKFVEAPPIPLDQIFAVANKYAPCQFFIATDEERILEEAKKMLKGRVIYYNSCRVARVAGVHNTPPCPGKTRAYLGEEALIDCILLSRCDLLIHTWSNFSIAALLFNPELEHIHLGR